MLTLTEFVTAWLGKKADWDGHYEGQCVDLFRYYCNQVLGIKQPAGVWGAANFWTDFFGDPVLIENFIRVPIGPDFVPQSGDVPIWDFDAGGGYGHVDIWLEKISDALFLGLDQNWPTLSKVTKTKHNYTNVYGVLRPKKNAIVVPTTPQGGNNMTDAELKQKLIDNLKKYKDILDFGEDKYKLEQLMSDPDMLNRIFASMEVAKSKLLNEKNVAFTDGYNKGYEKGKSEVQPVVTPIANEEDGFVITGKKVIRIVGDKTEEISYKPKE